MTARELYDARRDAILAKLEEIRQSLDGHEAAFAERPEQWGFAGDLASTLCRLGEAHACVKRS
jgi:hypothetical protein